MKKRMMKRVGCLFLAAAMMVSSFSMPVMAEEEPQLLLELKFEESVKDYSPLNNEITYVAGDAHYVEGVSGSALRMSYGSRVFLGKKEEYNPENLTLSFWIRSEGGMREQVIFNSSEGGMSGGWYVGTSRDNALVMEFGATNYSYFDKNYTVCVPVNYDEFFDMHEWTHVVITYCSETKLAKVWKNGHPVSVEYLNEKEHGQIMPNNSPKYIGYGHVKGDIRYLEATIDELKLYSGAADSKMIEDLFMEVELNVDKTLLADWIAIAKQKNNDDGKFTEESWNYYLEMIAYAETVYADKLTTQKDVDNTIDMLMNAMNALELVPDENKADKRLLGEIIAAVDALNAEDYTEESWYWLQEAYANATAVYEYEDAKQDEVDSAARALEQARVELIEAEKWELAASYDMTVGDGHLIDSTGNENHAKMMNFEESDQHLDPGQTTEDYVLEFDGEDNYVELPHGLIDGEKFAIEATFKTVTSADSWLWCIGSKEGEGSNVDNFAFLSPNTNSLEVDCIRSGIRKAETEWYFDTYHSISPEWYTTLRFEFVEGRMKLLENGDEFSMLETGISIQEVIADGTNEDALGYIGKSLYEGAPYFQGTLTQFNIYASSAEESEVDKDELREAVETEKNNPPYAESFTEDSMAAYDAAMEYAEEVLENEDATQKEVDAALNGLREAKDGLVGKVIECIVLPYEDVVEEDWYYGYVYVNYATNIMTGMDPTHFGPYGQLSRAQFTLMMYRMEGLPTVSSTKTFKDISGDEWYGQAVLWAAENGIVTGYQDGNFGPTDNITREQMAVMMYRYAKYLQKETYHKEDLNRFLDAGSVSDFAKEALQWAYANSIITGKESGTKLDPQGNTARCEASAIIQRFVKMR